MAREADGTTQPSVSVGLFERGPSPGSGTTVERLHRTLDREGFPAMRPSPSRPTPVLSPSAPP